MSQSPICDAFEPAVNPRRCRRCGWVKGRHRPSKKPLCPKTGKYRYPTDAAARVGLNRLMANPKQPRESALKLMPFSCPHCHGFHLGHHPDGDDDVAVAKPRAGEARS